MHYTGVTPIKHLSQSIFLTHDELCNLALEPGDLVSVKAGSASTNVIIMQHPEKNLISTRVLETLSLPPLQKLSIWTTGRKQIAVGPLIGIMANRSKKMGFPPFSLQNNLLRGFLNYTLKANYLGFIFYPEDVDMAHHKISGFFMAAGPEGSQVWKKHYFPLPDVVYDRILFRSLERKKLTREATAFLLRNKVSYFNPKFLSKWETYQILSTNPKLHKYLPHTKKYDRPESLIKFLKAYNTVYLKPSNGSLGKDIIRISNIPEGYRFQYRKLKVSITGVWPTSQELCTELPKLIKSKSYIIQQGLEFIKYNERTFDIRVLMQKNGQGQWVNTASVARVAAKQSIFPNIAAGGTANDIETVWRDLTSKDWFSSKTYEEIIRVSMAGVAALEQSLGIFGEAGLDIGIDALGNIWIIEINSKPSRKVFPPELPDLKMMSIKLPMDYAAYLAGFTLD
jgi:hypothetical protein